MNNLDHIYCIIDKMVTDNHDVIKLMKEMEYIINNPHLQSKDVFTNIDQKVTKIADMIERNRYCIPYPTWWSKLKIRHIDHVYQYIKVSTNELIAGKRIITELNETYVAMKHNVNFITSIGIIRIEAAYSDIIARLLELLG